MVTMESGVERRVADAQPSVMHGKGKDPEKCLAELFRLRHELLTVRTIAAQSEVVYSRQARLALRAPSPDGRTFFEDLADQFDGVRGLCDGEREFLQGVLDFYQTRTATKMNVAMERLALISAVMLPITALSSIYGMNIIVNEETQIVHLAVVIASMALIVSAMLGWTMYQGWW